MFGQIDGYDFEEPSDQDSAESSEDEIDIILNGSWEQKQRVRRRSLGLDEQGNDPADEFEREMERELNQKIKNLEDERSVQASNVPRAIEEKESTEFYDEIYFDSDEEKESDEVKVKRRKPTDDELLYDPNMDDDDQKWVDAQRRKYQPDEEEESQKPKPASAKTQSLKASTAPRDQSTSSSPSSARQRPLPTSDAVLNCPCCMILLCLDCQRHEIYRSQYRAMFVFNCRVDQSETLSFPTKNKRKLGKKEATPRMPPPPSVPSSAIAVASSSATSQQQRDSNEYYHPVRCNECNTEVAVFDADEVYHFYNALSSHV